MRCQICKYFSPDSHNSMGRCNNKKLQQDMPESSYQIIKDGLYVTTIDGGIGKLYVGADFGCIHFETVLK